MNLEKWGEKGFLDGGLKVRKKNVLETLKDCGNARVGIFGIFYKGAAWNAQSNSFFFLEV